MKKTLSILLLLALLPVSSFAQDTFFPIGGFNPPMTTAGIIPGADSCGLNIMGLMNLLQNETEARLSEMQGLGMKAFLSNSGTPNLSRHNLDRLAGGIYNRYEPNHPYFGREQRTGYFPRGWARDLDAGGNIIAQDTLSLLARVGGYNGTAWVCDSGTAGYAVFWDIEQAEYHPDFSHYYHRNREIREPRCADTNLWDATRQYTVTFYLKYQGTNDGDTVCRIGVVPARESGWLKRRADSTTAILRTMDFAGSDIYKKCSLTFNRNAGDSTWMYDFTVYSYGKKKVYVDYIEVRDAVYDSLNSNMYNQVIADIAETYSGTSAPYKDAVYRYYLCDEPFPSQLSADSLIREKLKAINPSNPIYSFTQVCSRVIAWPGRDTAIFKNFVNTCAPTELSINVLALFGAYRQAYQGIPRTPIDSGYIFQGRLDSMAMDLELGRKAANNASGGAIPLWVQVQSFGDYWGGQFQNEGLWRLPTSRELQCMVNLALCHGAKGIYYYNYLSDTIYAHPSYTGNAYQFSVVDKNGQHLSLYPGDTLWNTMKVLNQNISTISPSLLNIVCDNAFKLGDGLPEGSVITGLSDSLVQVGLFHHKTNANDKYFMLVNRHCLPTDTISGTITLNYTPAAGQPNTYFVADLLDGKAVTGILTGGITQTVTVVLAPGEGRLYRLIPFASLPKLNQGAAYTNFRFAALTPNITSTLSNDSIQITQKYWEKIQTDTTTNLDNASYHWVSNVSDWLPYSASSVQYLYNSAQNKANVLELQYKIDGGKISTPKFNCQIFFNDVAPATGSLSINNGAEYTNNRNVTVRINGSDAYPGLNQMRYADSPFGCSSGYVNLIKNGIIGDTTQWILGNAVYENGYLHLLGCYHGGVTPWQDSSAAIQIISGSVLSGWQGKILRLSEDMYFNNAILGGKAVTLVYEDSTAPWSKMLCNRFYNNGEFNTAGWDTFTIPVTTRPCHLEVRYWIAGIETPPPPPPPGGNGHNTLMLDNIRLEPVELRSGIEPKYPEIPPHSYIYDGWDYVDTINSCPFELSAGDGTKRIFSQLMDLPGNVSSEPGWYDDIILDMTKPYAGLESPYSGSYINGIVSMYGSSYDVNFDKWVVDYKKSNTSEWSELGRSGVNYPNVPLSGGWPHLCSWNTALLDAGTYLLRLTCYDKASNIKADTHYVYVNDVPTLPLDAITADFITFNCLPVDADCDQAGNIHITDTQANKIWEYSPSGDSLLCFGYRSTGQDTVGFNQPVGIAIDDSGFIWVADCYNAKIKKFNPDGSMAFSFGDHGTNPGQFNQPTGIAVKGGYVLITDKQNNRVQKFTRNGAYVGHFGQASLCQPTGIAVKTVIVDSTAVEKYYVSDSKHNRIVVFSENGAVADSIAGLGLNGPWDIAFDNNNNLYIADVNNNRIVELDSWHNQLLAFGAQGQEAGEFRLPQGLAVSPDGQYLYVVDSHNNRVQRFKMFFDIGTLGGPLLAGKRPTINTIPTVFGLSQCYPNPCKQITNINYQLAKPGQVSIKVYNTLGQLIKTLVNEQQNPGYYSVAWDGRNDNNQKVTAGVYFYRLQSGSYSNTKKAVVLR